MNIIKKILNTFMLIIGKIIVLAWQLLAVIVVAILFTPNTRQRKDEERSHTVSYFVDENGNQTNKVTYDEVKY